MIDSAKDERAAAEPRFETGQQAGDLDFGRGLDLGQVDEKMPATEPDQGVVQMAFCAMVDRSGQPNHALIPRLRPLDSHVIESGVGVLPLGPADFGHSGYIPTQD